MPIETKRLLLKPPEPGSGKACNEAIIESFAELHAWMPWAKNPPTLIETEEFARQAAGKWILREDLTLWIFEKATGEFLGGTGFHRMNWQIPRFEIGYWLRTSKTGQGYITEAVEALTKYAFKILKAKRIEIRCDDTNLKSRAIPERLGYQLDGILKMEALAADGSVRNTCVYSCLELSNLKK